MYVYWKPLTTLGTVFWLALVVTDVLQTNKSVISEHYLTPDYFEKQDSSSVSNVTEEESEKAENSFGATLLIINIFIFVFSVVICAIAKFFVSTAKKLFVSSKLATEKNDLMPAKTLDEILLERERLQAEQFDAKENARRDAANCEPKSTQTIASDARAPHLMVEQILRSECAKLRNDLMALQTTSLREHGLLSRKLESMAKEKRELSKRLSVVQKENQVAKTQLDELVNEKKFLQKRLDSVNKEHRFNTKTKKVALAKLEEVSSTVDDLRKQLEQTSRDKEILEGKLEVLRNEYEQLQARLRYYQNKSKAQMNEERMESAEKEENAKGLADEMKCNGSESIGISSTVTSLQSSNICQPNEKLKESLFLPYVISQTEVDMKNIQKRIMQLERNLKNFNIKKTDLSDETNAEIKPENEFSDIPDKLEFEGNQDEENKSSTNNDPTKKSYDELQLQMLTSALKDKVRMLETLKERDDFSSDVGTSETTTAITQADDEEGSSGEDEESSSEHQRIVSNSIAFQEFLRSIGGGNIGNCCGDSEVMHCYERE